MTTPTLVRTLTALVLVLWTALPALAQTTIARGPARNPFNGRLYLAVRNTAPANSAAMRDFARSLGGDLATIDDAAENEWVRTTFAVPLNAKLWIGLSDAASEGTFAWSDGSSATFRFWDTGEPSNSASSDAVLLNDSNGRWACRPDGATTVAVVELGHVIAVPQVAPTLTAAIDLASDASNVTTEVRLSPGTYRGTFDAGEKHLRIRGMGTASATVLDAEFAGRVLTADSSEDIELENLTLARGLVQGSGGAVVVSGSLHATNCIFRDNEARNPPFSRSGVGGAVAFTAGVGRFDGCVFENNRSALGGGAVYASEAQVVIDRGVLRRNRTGTAAVADDQIGLLQAVAAHVTITNTAILANQPGNAAAEPAVLCADAPEGGFSYAAGFRVQQCTIAGNDTNGTSQLRISPGSLSMSDSIVMLTGDSLLRRFGTVLVQNCISDSTNSSFTFVATDPMFVDLDGPDNVLGTSDDTLAVHANSPAIDGGRTSRYLGGTRDLAGNPRVAGAAIDLGAVESPVATCPADLDDGSGTGSPDGGVTIDDLLYFLARFEGGC